LKDGVLLGACLLTAADSLQAARAHDRPRAADQRIQNKINIVR
jgi:hypothetical protein